jgi:hypothetical protein
MKKYLFTLTFALALVHWCASAQTYFPFEQVRKYTKAQPANRYDSALKHLTNRLGAEIHYLYPFYQAIGWEEKFNRSMGEKLFNASFSDMLAFAGDYHQAMVYQQKSYEPITDKAADHISDTISKLRNIQWAGAKESIISNAPHYRVIMLNESHAKPVHRAFTYSLLEDLYKLGYRYLAMEAFNNFSNKCLDSLNVFTGYYTYEPVAGEMVRKALQLGYQLIAYEDTLASIHTSSQRDSVQARHLASVLKKDPSAKILVHAGSTHIAEIKNGGHIPMAYWLKKMSGADPFTVNQVSMTEGSEFEYGRVFYQFFNARFSITSPSVIFQGKRPFNPLEEKGYDMTVMHPATIYRNNRPTWLSLEGERKPTLIQPTEKMLFFVQAYYDSEYQADYLSYLVPADQTYITNHEGYYPLFLRKGKYKIVLRDVTYKILTTKDLEVM